MIHLHDYDPTDENDMDEIWNSIMVFIPTIRYLLPYNKGIVIELKGDQIGWFDKSKNVVILHDSTNKSIIIEATLDSYHDGQIIDIIRSNTN